MRILFLGDIVGPPGVKLVQKALPHIVSRDQIDLVIANAENAAGGSGLTKRIFQRLRHAGVGLFTLGDHIYRKAEIIPTLQEEEVLCKPANYPPEAPGRDHARILTRNGIMVAVICVLGRTFMRPVDCPFRAVDRVLAELKDQAQIVIVDAHAEATAEKYLLAHHLKGRVAAVLGTHTHVQTADEQIIEDTAFLCDVGMCGPHNGILGRNVENVLPTTLTFVPRTWDVARGDPRLHGAILEVEKSGKAVRIERFAFTEAELKVLEEAAAPKESPPPIM